ncbi:PhzF family phenazine biosynthesis isomerase [Candidatus Lariskella endosymbiont of Epinotia ramella]|uniref:PhzF family phenazine biosynthesis protein n=1 Tax=Candidatus Lariskella endosymbiont of Epinotia ramella TaxID=3066224 RepID=UPI0030D356B3
MKIWIVDAFTKTRFSGNPAGVCILEQGCDLDDKLMQSIASEFRISEIAFVKHLNKQHYSIRWFTPNSEAPICGHATVAAMHILTELGIEEKGIYIKFDSISGPLSAIKDFNGLITLNFPSYKLNSITDHTMCLRFNEIVGGIRPIEFLCDENCVVMRFTDPSVVQDLKPNFTLLSKEQCRALVVTSIARPLFYDCDFVFRYFAPKVDIDEDDVCGSAHCRLTPYWSGIMNKEFFISRALSKRGGVVYSNVVNDRVMISGYAVTVFLVEYLQRTDNHIATL